MKEIIKEDKGITLIIMVIMIVVMIILVGVTLNASAGEFGIIKRTRATKTQAEVVTISGAVKNEIIAKEIETGTTITATQVAEILAKYGTVQYEENGTTIKGIITSEGTEISMQELYDEEIDY